MIAKATITYSGIQLDGTLFEKKEKIQYEGEDKCQDVFSTIPMQALTQVVMVGGFVEKRHTTKNELTLIPLTFFRELKISAEKDLIHTL
jgi:hypothetical protein